MPNISYGSDQKLINIDVYRNFMFDEKIALIRYSQISEILLIRVAGYLPPVLYMYSN